MMFCIVAAHTVGIYMYVLVHVYSIDSTHGDVLIDTKQEAISYHSISPRGSLKSTSWLL